MKTIALATIAAAGLFALASAARAQTDESVRPNWNIGLDPGIIYPTSHREFSHTVSNSFDYDLLGNETVGDEVAEGFIAPPPNGSSTISATNKPSTEIQFHALRRFSDTLWLGFLAGWSPTHSDFIDSPGIYDQPGFTHLLYSSWYLHMAPVAHVQLSSGLVRPYLTVGPELHLINEHAQATFIDPDDSVQPVDVYDKTHVYAGALVGVGLDLMLAENGSLGISAEYHKVLAQGPNLDYITPHAVLSYYFR